MKKARETNNWQLDCVRMKQRGAFLFRTKLWSDIVLQFDNRKCIRAHKLLLAMASPVFGSMFYDRAFMNPVRITDLRAEIFNVLLEYIYSDNICIPSLEYACELYYAGQHYKMLYIIEQCVQYLSKHINQDNVCHIYEFACLGHEEALQKACLKIIRRQTKKVLSSDGFTYAQQQTVVKLFTLNNLNIDTELDLYVAAVKYAEANEARSDSMMEHDKGATMSHGPSQSKHARLRFSEDFSPTRIKNANKKRPNNSTKESDKSIRDLITKSKYQNILQHIRFLTLTPAEFAECKLLASLLTEEQIMALSMNIASRDTPVKMPEGFSYSMMPRSRVTRKDRQRISAMFHSKIHNVAMLKKHESIPFYIRNTVWTFVMIKDLNCHCAENILLAVTCCLDNVSPEWLSTVKVGVQLYLRRHYMKVTLNRQMNAYKHCRFYGMWTKRLFWPTKMHRLQQFANDNTMTYKVYVKTDKIGIQHDLNTSNVSQVITEGQILGNCRSVAFEILDDHYSLSSHFCVR